MAWLSHFLIEKQAYTHLMSQSFPQLKTKTLAMQLTKLY